MYVIIPHPYKKLQQRSEEHSNHKFQLSINLFKPNSGVMTKMYDVKLFEMSPKDVMMKDRNA